MTFSRSDLARLGRPELIEEFRRQPFGRHSPDLRLLLNRLRAGQAGGRYLLVCTRPFAEWRLARRAPGPGAAVTLLPEPPFASLEEAEWAVFVRLWRELTGEAPA